MAFFGIYGVFASSGGQTARTVVSQFVRNHGESISADLDHAHFVFEDLLSGMASDPSTLILGDGNALGDGIGTSFSIYDIAMM